MIHIKKALVIVLVIFLITSCVGRGKSEKGLSNPEASPQRIEANQNLEDSEDKDQAGASVETKETGSSEDKNSKPRGAGIALTFDDKTISDWFSIKELFSFYNARATFFVTKSFALTPDEVDMLRVLKEEGNEIGSHSVNHLNAVNFVKEYSLEEYLSYEIDPSIEMLEKRGFEIRSFAYPFGSRNKEIDKELLERFDIIRGITNSKDNVRAKDLDEIYVSPEENNRLVFALGMDRIYGNSIEEIEEGLDRAKEEDKVIILYGHAIGENPGENEYKIAPSMLEMIISAAYERGLEFYTISELAN